MARPYYMCRCGRPGQQAAGCAAFWCWFLLHLNLRLPDAVSQPMTSRAFHIGTYWHLFMQIASP